MTEPEEVLLQEVRAPVAEQIEREAGTPPADLELFLLGVENGPYVENGFTGRVLIGARYRSLELDFVGIGDLHLNPSSCTYRFVSVSDSDWRPWMSWGTPLAKDAILERYFEPFWAFGKTQDLLAATLYPAAWRELFGVEPLVNYPLETAAADLSCK